MSKVHGGLDPSHLAILSLLHKYGEMTARQLARYMKGNGFIGWSVGKVNKGALEGLHQLGLVERVMREGVYRYRVTEEGKGELG